MYFDMVEINSTFYGPPKVEFIESLNAQTDENTIFTAKFPHRITHNNRLHLNEETRLLLLDFWHSMRPLGKKLEALLIQLPPWHINSFGDLEAFFAELDSSFRFAIEFRHESWLTNPVKQLLERYNIAYVIVDEPLLPIELQVTTDFVYIRWHGHGKNPWYDYLYSLEELEAWKPRLDILLEQNDTILGFFNNHFYGNSLLNIMQMLELMGQLTPTQFSKYERMKKHKAARQTLLTNY
jgi:uncharacterized protein YecE (DUF72 family)